MKGDPGPCYYCGELTRAILQHKETREDEYVCETCQEEKCIKCGTS